MFRKLVSNLPFSPSLAGQLGFYVRRLKNEEATRRTGLILTALALAVQGFIAFAPIDAGAAASNNDIVYGGFTSKADLLRIYDRGRDGAGRSDVAQIYSAFGVSRADIDNAYLGRINSKDKDGGIYTTGRFAYNKAGSDERAVSIPGTNTTIYARKLRSFDAGHQIETGNGYPALIGTRASDGKWFAIVLACGNVDFTEFPAVPKAASSPAPASVKTPAFTATKTVANLTTQLLNADKTTASPGDRLEYTLSARNTGAAGGAYTFKDTVSDVLEYATIADTGGGTLSGVNQTADTLSWPSVTIAPGRTAIVRFVVRVKDRIPATAQNLSNPESYNCRMTNSFGQTTTVSVTCPAAKTVETVSQSLPSTGPRLNLAVAGIALAVVAYFYARSRQLGREIRLIRRDANAGTI